MYCSRNSRSSLRQLFTRPCMRCISTAMSMPGKSGSSSVAEAADGKATGNTEAFSGTNSTTASCGAYCLSTRYRSAVSKGFVSTSFMPAAIQRSRSSIPALAVRATTGNDFQRLPSRRIRRVASRPSISGIIMSIRTRSKSFSPSRRMASWPFSTTSAITPRSPRISSTISWLKRLSSASSTRIPPGNTGATKSPEICPTVASSLARVGSSAIASGSVNWKTLPAPTVLSTQIRPPIMPTSCREMARPRPVPPYFLAVEVSACEKAWKSLPICSCVNPMPVSATEKCSVALVAVCSPQTQLTSTPPLLVNLTALPIRLVSICVSRSGSPSR